MYGKFIQKCFSGVLLFTDFRCYSMASKNSVKFIHILTKHLVYT